MGKRLDVVMLDKGLVKTRSQARMLIRQGDVLCNGEKVLKPGKLVQENDSIEIKERYIYVGRGAFKLVKAIEDFNLNLSEKIVADCGASTGGFTQVSLLNGASKVYAIDVGHGQLDQTLIDDPRVINIEGVNLKNDYEIAEKVDLVVADLSFISLRLVTSTMKSFLKESGELVLLIKPQFEAGKERIGKGGIVDPEVSQIVLEETLDWLKEEFKILSICDSPITGKDGNVEYLVHLTL